jgi:hypothetical protein
MEETANILNNSTQDSFVILDEIGRGTSTIDGFCLAYGIQKYLHDKIKCRGIFATHYHEVGERIAKSCDSKFPGVALLQTQAYVDDVPTFLLTFQQGFPIFLYKVVKGVNTDSLGLCVAKLAGISQLPFNLQGYPLRLSKLPKTPKMTLKEIHFNLFAPMIAYNDPLTELSFSLQLQSVRVYSDVTRCVHSLERKREIKMFRNTFQVPLMLKRC